MESTWMVLGGCQQVNLFTKTNPLANRLTRLPRTPICWPTGRSVGQHLIIGGWVITDPCLCVRVRQGLNSGSAYPVPLTDVSKFYELACCNLSVDVEQRLNLGLPRYAAIGGQSPSIQLPA